MATLIIKDDNDIKHTYSLKNCVTTMRDDSLILELVTSDKHFQYQIYSDTRESNLNVINDFISQKLHAAMNNARPFTLSEYLARNYIYIGNIDVEERRQFTAHKLQFLYHQ